MHLPGGRSAAFAGIVAASVYGCDSPVDVAPCSAPTVVRSSVRPNPNNVLSAIVSAEAISADRMYLRFGRAGSPLDSATPSAPASTQPAILPLLGLAHSTSYNVQVAASNQCGTATGEMLSITTGLMPADLPRFTAAGSDPSPGYVVMASGNYGITIDNSGRIVWYHRFPTGPGLNFQPQPNGHYAARPSVPLGEIARWLEIDALGNVTRSLGCARGLQARMHDLLAQVDGSYWLLCDEVRTADLSSAGASAQAAVLGTGVHHIGATGEVLFDWSPFDHMPVELGALQPADRTGEVINWTHGNALDLDSDGNLLISFRNLSEVTKVDTRTGNIIWRMGGSRNGFTFENVAAPAYFRQHGLRSTGPGQFVLLDNLGEPGVSRAERYEYDVNRRTVRLVGSHSSSTGVIAQLGGTTQNLPGGRTLVSFGSGGSVEESDASGKVVWRIEGNPGYVFRAHRIRSLYTPGLGDPR